ncbi:MAG: hypothetical protein KDJ65_18730 [Anaerolineae bacterium]|nr:hypothetical protein [Anaerolineae bacterium]
MTKLKTKSKNASLLRFIMVALVLLLSAAVLDTPAATAQGGGNGGVQIILDAQPDSTQSFSYTIQTSNGSTLNGDL